jgi:AbrB family looped-hinge helix DNA binding protein
MVSESQTIGHSDIGRVGKRGAIVIPARLRRRFGIEEGSLVTAEEREEGILIRPAVAVPVEVYSQQRRAALLLSNATDEEDYAEAVREVRAMGLDPARIDHHKPRRRRR